MFAIEEIGIALQRLHGYQAANTILQEILREMAEARNATFHVAEYSS